MVALVLAAMLSLSISKRVRAVEDARQEWGATTTVLVIDSDVAPGTSIAGVASLQALPVAMVPAGALSRMPAHAQAKVALFSGEILLSDRITSASRSGIPGGTVALTMPVQTLLPLLAVGDLVDVWAVDPATASSTQVATSVVVLAFDDDTITSAVPAEQVRAATVASLRPVTITLIG